MLWTNLDVLDSSQLLLFVFGCKYLCCWSCCCSVTNPCPSSSLQPHRLQHTRLPCSSPISQSLLKLKYIESLMPSNHLVLCHLLCLLPSVFPSIRVSSNKSALCIRWPNYWSFSFSPSNDYSGLISFRIDWFDLLAMQRTLKRLL